LIRKGTNLKIEFCGKHKPSVFVYDACGRIADIPYQIEKEYDRYFIQFKTENLSNGVYFLILNDGRENYRKKIVIY